jgi:predicted ATPase
MSMARLWRDQGKREEARELLAPVYGWFTEGFKTLDLKEAEALLDELAARGRRAAKAPAPRRRRISRDTTGNRR